MFIIWGYELSFEKAYCKLNVKLSYSVLKIHTHIKYVNVCIYTQTQKILKEIY